MLLKPAETSFHLLDLILCNSIRSCRCLREMKRPHSAVPVQVRPVGAAPVTPPILTAAAIEAGGNRTASRCASAMASKRWPYMAQNVDGDCYADPPDALARETGSAA